MSRSEFNRNKDFGLEFSRFLKALLYLCALLILSFFIFIVLSYMRISSCAFFTYDSYQEVPAHEVGLLLGTSSHVAPGQPNDFFTNRIMAAANLYKKGKIKYILVSGDNRHASYNEPRMMMNALLKAGVPLEHIVADFAGFSTLDSVLRARRVFMLNDMLIISQDFHNERAIFIARANGIDAWGFNAANPNSFIANFKVGVREFFARLKCIAEVYLLDTAPTYLGDPIAIGNAPLPKLPTDKAKYPTSKPKHPGPSAEGLQLAKLEEVKRRAKQPTDSALILKQQRKAMDDFQRTLLQEEAAQMQQTQTPLVPMSSPVERKAELDSINAPDKEPAAAAAQSTPTEVPRSLESQPAPTLPRTHPQTNDANIHHFGDPWE